MALFIVTFQVLAGTSLLLSELTRHTTRRPSRLKYLLRSSVGIAILYFFYGLYVSNTGSATHTYATVRYSREELLNIDKVHHELKHSLLDFDYLLRLDQANSSWQDTATLASSRPTVRSRWRQGKKGGLHARLKARATRPPLPSLLLANIRSLENKMDELTTRFTTQRKIRE